MSPAQKLRVQLCPNCQASHDVGVYVSGQKLLCKCGIRFEVKRLDVSVVTRAEAPTTLPARGQPPPAPRNEVNPVPAAAPVDDEAFAFGATLARPPAARAMTPPGTPIDLPGYQLLEVLGRGGMGEVWRARQLSLDRAVAVKILPQKLAQDPEFVARFEKEATALASLNHPNIIQIIDRGVAGGHYYFAMEMVPGKTLRAILEGGSISPEQALKITSQICRAIDYAHEQGVIHRDLKPENILVDDRGHVKVADFGLANIRGGRSTHPLTGTAVAMGTVNYMAPEQRRDARNVDGRADLYSLGVVLYELLTGELPIGRFKLPSERIPGLDVRLDEVLSRALETDPDARYQRASAIGEVLDAVSVESLPAAPRVARTIPSRAPSVIDRGWKGLKVGLMLVGGLAVLGMALKLVPGRGDDFPLLSKGKEKIATKPLPPNTERALLIASKSQPDALLLSFSPGEEELSAHAGSWAIAGNRLVVTQAGEQMDDAERARVIPRAYVSNRYWSSDDFVAEVDMRLSGLDEGYLIDEDASRFSELAFRIKDLQVSVFAIPNTGMRVGWRYLDDDGEEQTGNSSRDVEDLLADEMPVPRGKFHVKLALKRKKSGTHVEAFVNGERLFSKMLPGLVAQTGKVALGCRNLHCEFEELRVVGREVGRPTLRRTASR